MLTDVDTFESVNLKCDPERAVELREQYDAVQPGYHMNKKHWNTVIMDGSVPDKLLKEWVDHSYDLVAAGLTKAQKTALESLWPNGSPHSSTSRVGMALPRLVCLT